VGDHVKPEGFIDREAILVAGPCALFADSPRLQHATDLSAPYVPVRRPGPKGPALHTACRLLVNPLYCCKGVRLSRCLVCSIALHAREPKGEPARIARADLHVVERNLRDEL